VVKVSVDPGLCQGHGLCTVCAPELFDIGDDGHAGALLDEVPADLVDAARDAAQTCPERAITVTK
jgi:ferredoxin